MCQALMVIWLQGYFPPAGLFVSGNKHNKDDFNHYLAHGHLGILKATAHHQGVRLVGNLVPRSGYL